MIPTRRLLALAAALPLALSACADDSRDPLSPAAAPSLAAAPAAAADAAHGRDETGPKPDSIFNRYIVRFRDGVAEPEQASRELVGRHGGVRTHVYSRVFKGFAAVNLPPRALEALRRNPNVASIEPDTEVPAHDTQWVAWDNWGLDRMDQAALPLNSQYNFFFNGAGSHVYVLDSGIRGDHSEFAGRLGVGENEASWDWTDPYLDEHGHGTRVAAAAAGATVGVARGATLHSVKINDEEGGAYASDIVDGIEWVIDNVQRPAVLNLSYGGDAAIRDALTAAVNAGITVTKSAGNDNADACDDVGNQGTYTLVVGSTNRDDSRRASSNWGSCVDISAPGGDVLLADRFGGFSTASGTSYAAPYVAGVAALILQQSPGMGAAEMFSTLRASATKNALWNLNGSPNLLANAQHQFARIGGVSSVDTYFSGSTKTWTASTLGGNGSWSFVWEASINGGAYQVVSYSSSYSRYSAAGSSYQMALKLTATSAGRSYVATRNVSVAPVEPEPIEECTNWKICP